MCQIYAFNSYNNAIKNYPLITPEREDLLIKALNSDNDKNARKELIESHLRLVSSIAKCYSGYGLPIADLIQEGNIGLVKAVDRFNPKMGVRLSSYAVYLIKSEIYEYIIKNWRIVKVATTKEQRKLFFNLRKWKNKSGWLNNDEVNMLSNKFNISVEEIRIMESRLTAQDSNLDVLSDNKGESNFFEDKASDVAVIYEKKYWQNHTRKYLSKAMTTLDQRSLDIINSRWLNENNITLKSLASKYSLSIERIRQIEKRALQKLREEYVKSKKKAA